MAGGVSYAWRRNGQPITDGPGGASVGGGIVGGASGTMTETEPLRLIIANAAASDSGFYELEVGRPCGTFTSQRVVLSVGSVCGSADFDNDGDAATDADIEAFFACLAGNCCQACWFRGADFDGDGDVGTDGDIEAFFRVLAGGGC
jgi:hypothetical protein